MALERSRAGVVGGWIPHPSTDVQKHPPLGQTETSILALGRGTVVPSAGGVLDALLDLRPCVSTLRQVSHSSNPTRNNSLTNSPSFFNVERSQIRPESAVQIHYTQVGGITGHVMLLCMLLMYTTAHFRIRQQSYETFWYTHHLFVPFLLALYTHATGCFVRDTPLGYSPFAGRDFWNHCIGYQGWRWELWGGGLYLCERIYREVRSRRETEIVRIIRHPYGNTPTSSFPLPTSSTPTNPPTEAMEIQFRKPSMRYKAGQWLFLNVPTFNALCHSG